MYFIANEHNRADDDQRLVVVGRDQQERGSRPTFVAVEVCPSDANRFIKLDRVPDLTIGVVWVRLLVDGCALDHQDKGTSALRKRCDCLLRHLVQERLVGETAEIRRRLI